MGISEQSGNLIASQTRLLNLLTMPKYNQGGQRRTVMNPCGFSISGHPTQINLRLKLHQKKCVICQEYDTSKFDKLDKFDNKSANKALTDFGTNKNCKCASAKVKAVNLVNGEVSALQCPEGENPMTFDFTK